MWRHYSRWLTGAILALAATGAAAGILPHLAVTQALPQTRLLPKPITAISPQIRQVVGTVQTTTARTIPSATQIISPLLNAPLSSPKPVVRQVIGGLGTASPARVPSMTAAAELLQRREPRTASITAYPVTVARDERGNAIARGRILVVDPDRASLDRLRAGGFTLLDDSYMTALDIRAVALAPPAGMNTLEGLRQLRSKAPGLIADYDHLYRPAGASLSPKRTRLAHGQGANGTLIGMIDGGVAVHPSLSGRIAEQRGFAGPAKATAHGTAVASLLAGRDRAFRGGAPGASLLVADVYGGRPGAGEASAIVRALGWMASRHARVVNISLVGPPNALLARVIAAARARGMQIVAAVGNDGPAAQPRYPASYPGVLAITGVDRRGIALLESGNSTHLDFAAPGADMVAARPGSGYAAVRGTSFAAPLAAGRLAVVGSVTRLSAEARPGRGRVGRGIVCADCRVDPSAVGSN